MPRHVWSVLCQKTLVDSATQLVSMIDVTEELEIEGEIADGGQVPVDLALVSYWVRSQRARGEEAWTRFHVIDPSGTPLAVSLEMEVELTTQERAMTVGRIAALPLSGAGVYELAVEHRGAGKQEWGPCAVVPVSVRVLLPLEPQGGDPPPS